MIPFTHKFSLCAAFGIMMDTLSVNMIFLKDGFNVNFTKPFSFRNGLMKIFSKVLWTRREVQLGAFRNMFLNPRPPPCKGGALSCSA